MHDISAIAQRPSSAALDACKALGTKVYTFVKLAAANGAGLHVKVERLQLVDLQFQCLKCARSSKTFATDLSTSETRSLSPRSRGSVRWHVGMMRSQRWLCQQNCWQSRSKPSV